MHTRPSPRAPYAALLIILASTATLTSTLTGTTEPTITLFGTAIPATFTTITYVLTGTAFFLTADESIRIERSSIMTFGFITAILSLQLTLFPLFTAYIRFTEHSNITTWMHAVMLIFALLYLTVYTFFRPRFLQETQTEILETITG